jgi:hypothetical protein
MIADCFRYYKGCEECQKHGDVQLVRAALMHPIIKLSPFRGGFWILLARFILHHQRGIVL